jgi:uncharacterized membrane protein
MLLAFITVFVTAFVTALTVSCLLDNFYAIYGIIESVEQKPFTAS